MHYITSVFLCMIVVSILTGHIQGYVDMGSDIGLLVFDEAHHAIGKHPYNMIMKNHYFDLPARTPIDTSASRVRPMVLGLTASPTYGANVEIAFRCVHFSEGQKP